jgi:hypothetical protein
MNEQEKIKEVERMRYRSFTVIPGLHGFKVKIGCSEVYFSTAQDVQREINNYFNDPNGTSRKFQREDIRFECMPQPTLVSCDPSAPHPPDQCGSEQLR